MFGKLYTNRSLPLIVAAVGLLTIVPSVLADRLAAPKLLPRETLAYVRIADTRELVEKFRETSVGRVGQDENIKPLINQLYGSAAEAFGEVEDQVGLSLDQLLAMPQGEICLALVAPPEGPPAIVGLLEVGDQLPAAEQLVQRGEEIAQQQGVTRTTELVGETTVTVLDNANDGQTVVHFEKDDTMVVVNNMAVARQIIARWEGTAEKDDETLAENFKFTTIMKRSQGTKDERPQVTWFVDPIELAKVATRGNFTAQAGLAVLPALGLDGLQAVGGSFIFAPEEFDSIVHLHVMLDNPRSGIIKMLAIRPGDTTPESWAPVASASYWTLNWDFDTTYTTFGELYDSFRGEGSLERDVRSRFSDRLGVDVEKEIIEAMEGRVTYITWMEKPARINSQSNLIGVKLKDAAAFRATLQRIVDEVGDNLEKQTFGGIAYYQAPTRVGPADADQPAPAGGPSNVRRPDPCMAILGDYLLLADSSKLLQQAIIAKSNASGSLAKDPEYKLIASRIERQVGSSAKPGMITFNRPEESFRLLYDLATGEESRQSLAARSGDNRFFGALHNALNDNPLPPFADVARHLAPGGGMLTSDETGFHYIGFALKRD